MMHLHKAARCLGVTPAIRKGIAVFVLLAGLSLCFVVWAESPRGTQGSQEPVETGYDLKTVIKTDAPPPGMPIKYNWRVSEKRLYAIPPRSKIRRITDPAAPAWVNQYFRLRKLYGELVYLYMSFGKPTEERILKNQNTWQMSGWVDYYLLTGDLKVCEAIGDWAKVQHKVWTSNDKAFKYGYWKKQDVDHGNEDTGYTFGRWWLIDPKDPTLKSALLNTATLAGNWGPDDVPQWYDWNLHRWRSYFLGSEHIGKITNSTQGNDPRLLNIALLAYAATGNERYLQLARDYLDAYVERFQQLGNEEPFQKRYLNGWVYNHKDPRMHHFNHVRYHFMESMAAPLLDVYRMTGDHKYLQTVRKIVEPALPDTLYHWTANNQSGILSQYRHLSGDHFMDEMVLDWVSQTQDYPDDLFSYYMRPLGNEDTNWDWMHIHWTRTHPAPTTYRLAYEITRDLRYLSWMLEGAIERAQILYAQQSRPETRHGPDRGTNDWDWRLYWLAFEITDVLFPMAGRHHTASGEGPNAVSLYDVRFFRDDGSTGLPETIAVNYRVTVPTRRLITLYNAADAPATILVQPQGFLHKTVASARAVGADLSIEKGRIRLTLPPHAEITLDVTLSK
jgi:hypothetical protein